MKRCCHCEKLKKSTEFYNDKSRPDGKTPRCKDCFGLNVNKKKRLKYEKEYRDKHRERKREIKNKCYANNKEKYHKKRQERYKDLDFIASRKKTDHNRRLLEKGDLTTKQLSDLILNAKNCYYCNKELRITGYELDHKTPLSRGGKHTLSNVVISCMKCNRQKGIKTEKEFIEGVSYQVVPA